MTGKRKQDIWNERAEAKNRVIGAEAEEFVQNIAQNREGVSAEMEKFHFDETTTPKVLPPNKRD